MSSDACVGRYSIGDLMKAGVIFAHKDGNFGSLYPRIEDFVNDGLPLLTAKVVNAGRVDFNAAQKLSKEKAAQLPYGFVQPEDVLLSHNATVGRVAVVPEFTGKALIGTSLTYFRLDKSRLLPRYLACFFESRDFQNQLASVMGLSTRNQVPITAQRLLEVEVPPMAVQYQISEFVGALDDRITLLRETNATLEAIAQALFKSWFVDFDPVRAKMEGRTPEGMDEATAALFPDSFEETGLSLVPRGWRWGTLGVVAETARNQIQPEAMHETLHYVGLEHIPRKCLSLNDWGVAEGLESAKSCFSAGDILFGKLRPYFHKVVVAPIDGVCSTDILVCRPTKPCFYGFSAMQLFSEPLVTYSDRLSNGAKMPRVNWKDLAAYEVVIPDEEVAEMFTVTIQPLLNLMAANTHQAQTLSSLRDTLLPRLISGQLRLPDLQQLMEEAIA